MNLMLRIVVKDFRRLRGRIAFWIAVMLLKTGLALWLIWGGGVDDSTFDYVGKALIVLVATEVALTFLLAAMIVQEDPLAGDQPFWRTRPISGARLFGAKVIGLGVLLGAPVVLTALPWWLACAGGMNEIAWVTGQMLLLQAVIVAPAVLVATLTDTLGRFLLWSLVLLMAHAALTTILPLLVNGSFGQPTAFAPIRLASYLGVSVIVGIGVILAQYLGRNRRRSIVGLGVGWIVAVMSALWWPWQGIIEDLGHAANFPGDSAAVAMEVIDMRLSSHARWPNQSILYTHVRMTGLPESVCFDGHRSVHLWQWPDGSEQRVQGWGISSHQNELGAVRAMLRFPASVGANRNWARNEGTIQTNTGAILPAPLAERIRREPAKYTVTAELVTLRPEVRMEVPLLGQDAWQARAGYGMRVLHVEAPRANHIAMASLLETEFVTPYYFIGLTRGRPGDSGAMPYVLLDRAEGSLKALTMRVAGDLIISGVQVSVPLIQLDEADVQGARARELTLARVGWQSGAKFSPSVTVERPKVR